MSALEKVLEAQEKKLLSEAAAKHLHVWLTEPKYREYVPEIEAMILAENWEALEDSFFKVVPFGTGGRRGTVGAGSNRINRITIGEAAQGFVDYLLSLGTAKGSAIAVGYDNRLTSVEFSRYVSSIFAANGFVVHLFDGIRSTPELSFAVRHLGAVAGAVVSASHNPSADNGIKVYWNYGGQVVPPHDVNIIAAGQAVSEINTTDFDSAVAEGKIKMIGTEVDEAYWQAVVSESLSSERGAKIVYSPLHGTGITSVVPVLERAGFTDVTIVAEQASPDGHFTNVKNHIANPEIAAANEMAVEYAGRLQADIAITTDPDADRLGVAGRDAQGKYVSFNGNQSASLICDYVLGQMKAQGILKPTHFVVETMVTTDLISAIAQSYGAKVYSDLLVGFKYIGKMIEDLAGKEEFVMGGEESYGILKGTYTREKDSAVAALLIAEAASLLKKNGSDLPARMDELFRQHGIYWETLHNIMYTGAAGFTNMRKIMVGLREKPVVEIAGEAIKQTVNHLVYKNVQGMTEDVLVFRLSEDGRERITVRPSGTEPKLKVYVQLHQSVAQDISSAELAVAKEQIDARAKRLTDACVAIFESFLV